MALQALETLVGHGTTPDGDKVLQDQMKVGTTVANYQ
jgi:hypothetical protein